MKHIISTLVFMLTALVSFAKTDFTIKTFTFGEFSTICNNTFFDIKCVYNPQKAGTVDVQATELGFKYLAIKYSDNTLNLGVKRNSINNLSKEFGKVTVYYSHALENVAVNGSGDIDVPSIESKGSVLVTVNGSGDIEVGAASAKKDICVSINGSGDIEVDSSQAKDITVAVNGSGDVSMSNISATEVNANVNGSGEIELKGSTSNASYLVIGSGEVEAHRLIAKSVVTGVTGSGEITYNRGANVEISGRKKNVQAK